MCDLCVGVAMCVCVCVCVCVYVCVCVCVCGCGCMGAMLSHLSLQCLKNKLGTRQLPTAELLLDGTEARLVRDDEGKSFVFDHAVVMVKLCCHGAYDPQVGEQGRGVPGISSMLTITRLHNSIAAVAGMRR